MRARLFVEVLFDDAFIVEKYGADKAAQIAVEMPAGLGRAVHAILGSTPGAKEVAVTVVPTALNVDLLT